MASISIYTDGIAKENPGPAAIAAKAVSEDGSVLFEFAEPIGNANSDYAQYYAITSALQKLQEKVSNKESYELVLCNEKIAQQLRNEIPITNASLVPFFIEVHNLRVTSFSELEIVYSTEASEARKMAEAVLNA